MKPYQINAVLLIILISGTCFAEQSDSKLILKEISSTGKIELLTTCDIDNNGYDDIVTYDGKKIVIDLQTKGFKFDNYAALPIADLIALNKWEINGKEYLVAFTQKEIIRISFDGKSLLPTKIMPLPETFAAPSKSSNPINYVYNLNNTNSEQLFIPLSDGILILDYSANLLKQIFIKDTWTHEENNLNDDLWPRLQKDQKTPKGISLNPSTSKAYDCWIYDFNQDGLGDIIVKTDSSNGFEIKTLLQKKNLEFVSTQKILTFNMSDQDDTAYTLGFETISNQTFFITKRIIPPLNGNSTLFPIIKTTIYKTSNDQKNLHPNPIATFKSVFIPGFDTILHSNRESIALSLFSALKINDKEELLRTVTKKELTLQPYFTKIVDGKIFRFQELPINFKFHINDIDSLQNLPSFIQLNYNNKDSTFTFAVLNESNQLSIYCLDLNKQIINFSITSMIQFPQSIK